HPSARQGNRRHFDLPSRQRIRLSPLRGASLSLRTISASLAATFWWAISASSTVQRFRSPEPPVGRHDPDLRRFGTHAGRSLGPDFRGGGTNNGSPNTLYFTDGIDGEAHGLFGAITSASLVGTSTPTHSEFAPA